MKYIKKVSASQLISSEGTIIDSMNPGDDQTVNAPSIHAVKEYISDNVNNYSTTGTVIGTWITGKPLYRKVISVGTLTQNGVTNIAHNISNLGLVTNIVCTAHSGQSHFPIPFIGNDYMFSGKNFGVRIGDTNVTVYCPSGVSVTDTIVILEYTKTTD